ncbi:MAG: hypothetical protein E6H07_17730 [Bacteroidetes bacterium]|nr:MAG: hypothetical protein E6H07_17730 [Bacteroidota bacterium]
MRNLKPLCAAIMLLIGAVSSNAQETAPPLTEPNYKKPQLFTSLPENIKVNVDNLKVLLKSSTGDAVASDLGNVSAFDFNGQVVSTASTQNNMIKSVVIRSSNYSGASLTISQITNEDGSISYTGRIISFNHGDLFELKQQPDGTYAFVKKKFYDLVNE